MAFKNNTSDVYMTIPWHDYATSPKDVPIKDAALTEKASVIGRIGIGLLGCGATAWLVRRSMSSIARLLGVTCVADIGIVTINYTCYQGQDNFSQAISLDGVGVNAEHLGKLENIVSDFEVKYLNKNADEIHTLLDKVRSKPFNYGTLLSGLLAGTVCSLMVFLGGGGWAEMLCVFFAAGIGCIVKTVLNKRNLSIFIGITAAAAVCCGVYALFMLGLQNIFNVTVSKGAGYMFSMIFLIPGYPFVTSILDFAKLDMRSGVERLTYSVIIVGVATAFAWAAAAVFSLSPEGSMSLDLHPALLIIFRFFACGIGVFCITMLFNSPVKLAICAAVIGAIANSVRLVMMTYVDVALPICYFAGAFIAGLLSAAFVSRTHFPRSCLTIGALMVSVPGVAMYKTIYYFSNGDPANGLQNFISVVSILFATALGILFAKYLTDRKFRYRD